MKRVWNIWTHVSLWIRFRFLSLWLWHNATHHTSSHTYSGLPARNILHQWSNFRLLGLLIFTSGKVFPAFIHKIFFASEKVIFRLHSIFFTIGKVIFAYIAFSWKCHYWILVEKKHKSYPKSTLLSWHRSHLRSDLHWKSEGAMAALPWVDLGEFWKN